MKLTRIHIENFRSIRSIEIQLDETTVFIGPNNAGKSAVLEAVRIALSRRWGQRGTGFTENDVHLQDEGADPRTAPPVKVTLEFKEPMFGAWPAEMVANLDEIMTLTADGLNKITVSINYIWNVDEEIFEPTWEFLNSAGHPLPARRRAINLSGFYDYIIFFWLGALRDVEEEFTSRSRNWGGLLKTIKVPSDLEKEIENTLDVLDAKLLAADPNLSDIATTIGRATEIAIEDTPGAAKLRMLPLNTWDMLARAGVIVRNDTTRPWLPLDHHGQGLQSLSVIFLFQAAVAQQLSRGQNEGAEPIFAIEEPEVHLHPQAARTLWTRMSALPGQKLVTTHSPYFVQNVPLHNLRIIRFRSGSTEISALSKNIVSSLAWTPTIEAFIVGRKLAGFQKDSPTGKLAATFSFTEPVMNDLLAVYSKTMDRATAKAELDAFRHSCRILISPSEESDLSLLGRRIRGEIFFARHWLLVEGPTELLLVTAMGQALGYDLDQHGVAVIDFQNNGNASIYPALAEAFGIPWDIISDGDAASEAFKKQLLKRGFSETDLAARFKTLTPPHDLEDQLIADGHETVLRTILKDIGVSDALTCSLDEFKKRIKNKKTAYMAVLAPMVASDPILASKMPKVFVAFIDYLKK